MKLVWVSREIEKGPLKEEKSQKQLEDTGLYPPPPAVFSILLDQIFWPAHI